MNSIRSNIELLLNQSQDLFDSLRHLAKTSGLLASCAMEIVQLPEYFSNNQCNICFEQLQVLQESVITLQKQLVSAGVIEKVEVQ